MKNKVLFLVAIIGLLSWTSYAQRGVRIGYIDTEYILQNVPEYQAATSQLDKKVIQWKNEIEQRLNEVAQKKKQLTNESVLLTKELYEERLEDISFEEADILDYQQKRFGPNGDLMLQKQQLIQPIQDQIFAAVQEIAGTKKYDFIFDKSADVVMLYSAERFDISELVLRSITRSSKRQQAQTKADRKAADNEEVVPVINAEQEARQKALDEKAAERQKLIEDRQKEQQEIRDTKAQEAEARRQKILDDRAKAKAERDAERKRKTDSIAASRGAKETGAAGAAASKSSNTEGKTKEQLLEEKKQQKLIEREKRKQELEARKQKILEERAKAKQEAEEARKKKDTLN
ncbi:MAG: hypothetical protein BM564_08720 [Bacteroidetes bacterium MedPE-SWsnd-G2]|nr:MAG: hypothetical protein BM564_08720 [Bacteroidetes bacterium MedPE-SWsnd-G2]